MLSFVLSLLGWTKLTDTETIGMSSRTPIRLTPHRGPLATPSASPASSPTLSTPPSDISYCSTAIRQTLDVASLQHRISTLSSPTSQSRLYPWMHQVTKRHKLFGPCLYPHTFVFESLIGPTYELGKALAGIVTFCLLIWGILEWSFYASELAHQSNPWASTSRFPLPFSTRALRCHANPLLCEPGDQHAAVLQFLSEQIQHAKALSALTVSLGLPLRSLFEANRAIIPRAMSRHNLSDPAHPVQEVDTLANISKLLDPPILDFTSNSFLGRSFTLALDELDDLISEPMISYPYGVRHDAHLHAIYWRTTSNLLLEYSAARPRARRLLQHIRALHQQLSPLAASDHHAVENVDRRLNMWWWKGTVRHPTEDGMQALVTGLEITLDNLNRLIAYLDWITEYIARATLRDVLEARRRTDFLSCMTLLQDLFAQSKASTSKRYCHCLNDCGVILPSRLERVNIMVPSSPTVRVGR